MRVRLCKLKSPNERTTNKCMNENILKIEPKEKRVNMGLNNQNEVYAISGTSYVLNTPKLGRLFNIIMSFSMKYFNFFFIKNLSNTRQLNLNANRLWVDNMLWVVMLKEHLIKLRQ